jgi:cAMP-dependent protein kinase regulator
MSEVMKTQTVDDGLLQPTVGSTSFEKLRSHRQWEEYLSKHRLTMFLQEMVSTIRALEPADPYEFMAKYLIENKQKPGTHAPVEPASPKPRAQRPSRKSSSVSMASQSTAPPSPPPDEYWVQLNQNPDQLKQLESAPPAQDSKPCFKRHANVYSESVNPHEVKLVTYPKADAETTEIQKHLLESTSFLFKGLTQDRAAMMASAMFKKEATVGETVIKQGDDGDNFYLIGSGGMEVFVQRDPNSEPVKVLQLVAGGTFGELALMYQSPRAATVVAMSDSVLWCLDRVQFKALCSGAEQQQTNEEWVAFLEKVEVLNTLNKFELIKVASDLEEEYCGENEVVIEQGDNSSDFMYILESGTCVATLDHKDGSDPETVKEYIPGDYFGELALLQGGPRTASVKVTCEEAHFLKIPVDTFKKILGPVHDLMQKNANKYKCVRA